MKKSKSILILSLVCFAFIGCKKTYTCTCSSASSSFDAFKLDYKDKADAEAFCQTYSTTGTTCVLK